MLVIKEIVQHLVINALLFVKGISYQTSVLVTLCKHNFFFNAFSPFFPIESPALYSDLSKKNGFMVLDSLDVYIKSFKKTAQYQVFAGFENADVTPHYAEYACA